MKQRYACPWWDFITRETACVSPGHARNVAFVIRGLAVSLSWCCSVWFVLELKPCGGVFVVLFWFCLVYFFSILFFSFESFLRFHCLGTLSTCLVFKFLLLNCIKREAIREQSKSLRPGSALWPSAVQLPSCTVVSTWAGDAESHLRTHLVVPVARHVLSVTLTLSCTCLACAKGLLSGDPQLRLTLLSRPFSLQPFVDFHRSTRSAASKKPEGWIALTNACRHAKIQCTQTGRWTW